MLHAFIMSTAPHYYVAAAATTGGAAAAEAACAADAGVLYMTHRPSGLERQLYLLLSSSNKSVVETLSSETPELAIVP